MGQQTLDVMKFKLNQPALIEASAGTGKTYTITNLVLRILLGSGDQQNSLDRPLPIEDLLVVTFTNTATADLRRRIYERIRTAHMLFENFLEVAKQELKQKVHDLASKKIKHEAAEEAKAARAAAKEAGILNPTVPEHNFEAEIESFCQRFFADESIDPQMAEAIANFKLNVDTIAKEKLNCNDAFLIQLLKQIADKDAVKQAISVLIRAERNIDNASICTIHSFCNRTLTQIYAFEASEAFTSELTNDLVEQEDEAAITVWRHLFYKLNASTAVLRLLKVNVDKYAALTVPKEINTLKKDFSSVRLSQEDAGVFGYQLKNFKLPGFSNTQELSKEYRLTDIVQRMFLWVDILDYAQEALILQCYEQWRSQFFTKAQEFIDFASEDINHQTFDEAGKEVKPVKAGTAFIKGICGLERSFNASADVFKQPGLIDGVANLLKQIEQSSQPLDCAQMQASLAKLRESKLKETIGHDVCEQILSSAKSLLGSEFDTSTNKLLGGNKKSMKEGSPYFEFHPNFQALVAGIRKLSNAQRELRSPLTALLYMLVSQQLQMICDDEHLMGNDDLLLRLDQALQRPGFGERLAHLIRLRYPLAMIDEFQDTDPIQYSIFSKIYLNADALKEKAYCYLIGDPKQSIYAFRGSDINSYLKARDSIKRLTDGKGLHTLGVNYRSTEDVIEASNAIFSRTLNPDNVSPFKESNIPFNAVGVSNKFNAVPLLREDISIEQLQQSSPDSVVLAHAWGSPFVIQGMFEQELIVGDKMHTAQFTRAELRAASFVGKTSSKSKAKGQSSEPLFDDAPQDANNAVDIPLPLANTYVVRFNEVKDKNAGLDAAYAHAAALLIKKVLQDGQIIDKAGNVRSVKPSDIAILVRSVGENDKIQQALQDLGLSSVYFSDRSSVLFNDDEPTSESLDLLYLMEAMSDPSNRSKVMRVLGSGLLHFNPQEFLDHSNGYKFEREVMCLNKCFQVWEKYGFLPAFIQWCDAPEHQVTARLLSIINGERALTNYTQLSELIQAAHNQHSGVQAQIRWYYDTLFSGRKSFDADDTQKRLESEHEQIKILTIHKSKGLEFPIVFMPFLWRGSWDKQANKERYIHATKYYAKDLEHRVLDFDEHQQFFLDDEEKIARYKLKLDATPPSKISYTPQAYERHEDAKERTRLLYVALTRARYANFIFMGSAKSDKKGAGPSALMELFNFKPKEATLEPILATLEEHPDIFTIVDGDRCSELFAEAVQRRHSEALQLVLSGETETYQEQCQQLQVKISALLEMAVKQGHDLYQAAQEQGQVKSGQKLPYVLVGHVPLDANLYEQIKHLRQEMELLQVNNVPILPDSSSNAEVEACAMSFTYDGAVDTTFNIMSYSRLTSGHDPVKKQLKGQRLVSMRNEDEDGAVDRPGIAEGEFLTPDSQDAQIEQQISNWVGQVTDTGVGGLVGGATYKNRRAQALANKDVLDTYLEQSPDKVAFKVGLNETIQNYWDAGYYREHLSWKKRPSGLNFDFTGGADSGTFLHEVLRMIRFEEIQSGSVPKEQFFHQKLQNSVVERSDLKVVYNNASLDSEFIRLSDWLIDIVEAPILKGHYQNLALADLQVQSYVPEMKFLMTSKRFNTTAVDKLCQEMAKEILPPERHELIPHLKITQDELFGFITGSLDLACRFDLNYQGDLKYREDLFCLLQDDHVNLFREAASQKRVSPKQVKPDYKYYVIDYKSNILGSTYESYSTNNMIEAIYSHRYDVQFLFYTVALYRFLKRRMGVDFNADKQMLEQFYDQNIGGVMYLFIRGMQGDYLRRNISPGVFSLKIAFKYVYELDQIFGADERW